MSENRYEHVRKTMIHQAIPPGQPRLYKALLEASDKGLTLDQLSQSTSCSHRETGSTIGGLGKRVSQACGKIYEKPSRLLIERDRRGVYKLSSDLLQFIQETQSLQNALHESSMEMFSLHTKQAWGFEWNSEKSNGQLVRVLRG